MNEIVSWVVHSPERLSLYLGIVIALGIILKTTGKVLHWLFVGRKRRIIRL